MLSETRHRLKIVKCTLLQEFHEANAHKAPDASPYRQEVILSLMVNNERRMTVGEGDTLYASLHNAFAKALTSEMDGHMLEINYPDDEAFPAMLQNVLKSFEAALRLISDEQVLHPAKRQQADVKTTFIKSGAQLVC